MACQNTNCACQFAWVCVSVFNPKVDNLSMIINFLYNKQNPNRNQNGRREKKIGMFKLHERHANNKNDRMEMIDRVSEKMVY